VIDLTLTQSELLSMWERGEGKGPSGRALALLSAAGPGDSPASMPVGRRDASLLSLREQIFGSAFAGVTSCPACGEEIELGFDAREVRRESAETATLRIADGTFDVSFRVVTTEDLAAIERLDDVAVARERLLARCIVDATRDGERIDAAELPESMIGAIAARMSESDPQADVQLDAACPACAHQWREPFDIAAFLWTELSVFVRRLLGDVHELARAYGWSEREILALPPSRRAAYLEMLR
jgi:hypothetical protein